MSSANPTAISQGHDAHSGDHGGPHLAHHFDSAEQQNFAAKLGMWVFLGTEVLMFGGLFCAYSIFRHNHPAVFAFAAESYLNTKLGALNTVILISSSLTMAWGVRAAQMNNRGLLIVCLILTLLGAAGFMVVKTVEYSAKWREDVWIGQWNKYNAMYHGPNAEAPPQQPVPPGGEPTLPTVAANIAKPTDANTGSDVSQIQPRYIGPTGLKSDVIMAEPTLSPEELTTQKYRDLYSRDQWRVSQFFSIYFLMTGLHGLHVLIGMGLISWLIIKARQGTFSSEYYTPVDLIGLYWHLVDLIWIFLFPLLYLIH
jgi:cytochrome c oxidase subunit III